MKNGAGRFLTQVARGLGLFGIALFAWGPTVVNAKPEPAPLAVLPLEKLQGLAPLLRNADVALLESTDKDHIKQLTTITYAAAPPETVREVVAHPEKYAEFVRNMNISQVKPEPGGTLFHEYKLSYKFHTVDGRHRYVFLPPSPGHGAAPIEMYDPDENGTRHYRWEFLPAPGGSLIVLYGYTEIPWNGVLEEFMKRAPTIEFGFGLITQWALVLAMKQRATELAGRGPLPALSGTPNIDFLLSRGTLAIFRTQGDLLKEVNLIDKINAPADLTLKVAGAPHLWQEFVPSLRKTVELKAEDGTTSVEIEQSLPLFSWTTRFAIRQTASAVDMLGIDGDLQKGRLRWDATPLGNGRTQLVLRTDEPFERTSLVLRQLYKLEPLFKYGVNIGLAMVILRAIEKRAELLVKKPATP